MPWDSVAELKQSETWKRSETLRKMPEFRLRRFLAVFNAIHKKKTDAGAPADEADSTAFSMAYAAARRFQATPEGSKAEAAVHYAATLASMQFSQGGEIQDNSFEWLTKNIGLVNAAVAGNCINLDHKHHEPIGIVRRLLLPSEVPGEIAAKMASDTPFVTEYSYFEGTPDDLKDIQTVSAEWLMAARKDGRDEVLFPDSFSKTESPATDQTLGVGKIAEGLAAKEASVLKAKTRNKLHASSFGCPADRTFPLNDKAHVKAALSRLGQQKNSSCSTESIRRRIHAAAKHFGVEVTAAMVASDGQATTYLPGAAVSRPVGASRMADSPVPLKTDPALVALEAKVASMSTELEASTKARTDEVQARVAAESELRILKEKVATFETERLEREATDAAQLLVASGKVASEDAPFWAGQFKTLGKSAFNTIADKLPRNTVGVAQAKAASAVPEGIDIDGANQRLMLASIDPKRFAKKGGK